MVAQDVNQLTVVQDDRLVGILSLEGVDLFLEVQCKQKVRKKMHLNETLKNCLFALESRYPECVVDGNEAVPGHTDFQVRACSPLHLIELLQVHSPQVLQAPACLVIDAQQSVIYLLEQPQEIPAFWIHCKGVVPTH